MTDEEKFIFVERFEKDFSLYLESEAYPLPKGDCERIAVAAYIV